MVSFFCALQFDDFIRRFSLVFLIDLCEFTAMKSEEMFILS